MEKSGCCTYSTHFSIVSWVSSSTKRQRGITTFEVLRTTWANKSKSSMWRRGHQPRCSELRQHCKMRLSRDNRKTSQMLNFKSCMFLPPSLVKQPRRRRLKERPALAYSTTKTKNFASLACAFFIVCTFRSCSCPIHDVKWPILQFCGHMTTLHDKFSSFSSPLHTADSNLIPGKLVRIWYATWLGKIDNRLLSRSLIFICLRLCPCLLSFL